MSFELNAAFSLSVGIGAAISWIRFKKADPAYLPFFTWLWIGFITEIASIFIMKRGYSNAVIYNLFSLLEAIIILWQFKKWGLFGIKTKLYYILVTVFLVTWFAEIVERGGLNQFVSFFIIGYATIIVFVSISIINSVVFKESTPLLLNSQFLICIGLIVYFTYMALIEIFWLYGLNRSSVFRIRVYDIFAFINLFTNLLFGFAALWIPMKRRYLLRS
jgi:hypothetical protein